MKNLAAALLLSALLLPALSSSGFAYDWHDQAHTRRGMRPVDWDRHWHGDIHHFHDYDLNYWRGGHWFHGHHEGRLGWWWILGDGWYYYPAPVYPYPNPYTPPAMAPPAAPASTYWYWCPHPRGYYPYVPECPRGWRAVPSE